MSEETKQPFLPEAVFSDGTEMFRSPAEPCPGDSVKLRIRTYKDNVQYVFLHFNGKEYVMAKEKKKTEDSFDYFSRTVTVGSAPCRYYFSIETAEGEFIYNRTGLRGGINSDYDFLITPGFKTPDWAKGAVVYQIYVDRFCNADPTNDVLTDEYAYLNDHVRHVESWNRYPQSLDVREFYGGDLAGIRQKLNYLQDLGVEVIYLNPIFVSPSNHKYDAQDYDNIDPHFGVIKTRRGNLLAPGDMDNANATCYKDAVTNLENRRLTEELFISLVEELHRRGMKIILDGVFNHCGSFNKWMDREHIYDGVEGYDSGAFESEYSKYRNYFTFKDENAWPNNTSYDGWWGNETLPKLNYEQSPELYDYIMKIGRKWVSPPYNCDGWRLDVAADLGHSEEFNHKFWKDFRDNVKDANPDAIILAEHYGDPRAWLKGDQWDTVMNYDAFMEPVTWFFTGMEKHSDSFSEDALNNGKVLGDTLIYNSLRFQTNSLQVAMNELSNHDHSRFMTRTNRTVGRTQTLGPEAAERGINPAVMREAVLFQMTWPGAPTIYYGDEAGVCGWTDPDNRRTYPWGREDTELIRFHKEAIDVHRDYDAIKRGSCKILLEDYGIFAFGRFDEKDKVIVCFNNNLEYKPVVIPVWQLGLYGSEKHVVRLIYTNSESFGLDAKIYNINDGYLRLVMPPFSGIVLKNMHDIFNRHEKD